MPPRPETWATPVVTTTAARAETQGVGTGVLRQGALMAAATAAGVTDAGAAA